MKRINKRVEMIFAQAAALQQSGRLRSTIYCRKQYVYILNQDNTLIIQFPLKSEEVCFTTPISFYANDYDSTQFRERDGAIIFIQNQGEFQREKRCRKPTLTPDKVRQLFHRERSRASKENRIPLNKEFLNFLDDSVTHIEFSGKNNQLTAVQRNIYDGSLITITRKGNRLFQHPCQNFRTLGLRTYDFMALFTFTTDISFYFSGTKSVFFENRGIKAPFQGIISRCIYDELGVDDGREKS